MSILPDFAPNDAHFRLPVRSLSRYTLIACIAYANTTLAVPGPPNTQMEFALVTASNPSTMALRGTGFHRVRVDKEGDQKPAGHYLQSGVQAVASPAFLQGGVHAEWSPWTFLQLRLQYDYFRHLGQHGSLLGFDDPGAAYGDRVLTARKGTETASHSHRASAHPVLRMRWRGILFSDSFSYYFYRATLDQPYFLERALDVLVAKNGRVYSNKIIALKEIPLPWARHTSIGPMHEVLRSVETGLTRQRVGVIARQFFDHGNGFFAGTHWFFQTAYNLSDRNRENGYCFALGVGGRFGF